LLKKSRKIYRENIMKDLLFFGSVVMAVLGFIGVWDMIKHETYNLMEYFICVNGILIGTILGFLLLYNK